MRGGHYSIFHKVLAHSVAIPLSPPNSCFMGLGTSAQVANSILERMNSMSPGVGLDLSGQRMKGPRYLENGSEGDESSRCEHSLGPKDALSHREG